MGKYDFDFDVYEENTLSWIARTIKEESKVLEFGAANGRLTQYLSNKKKCIVDIVEIDEESGREAAQYADEAYVGKEDGDIENYNWVSSRKKYDYIVFADVLEHLLHPQEVLDRCKAVIAEGGNILVSVPNVSHNSVIISLINDEFEYNPIGLLDNTHIKFFTRKSFAKMAERVGWAVVGEKAKYIRVGENEISISYQDVSKEVFKELVKRDNGDVYQYMFTLALSNEYLVGKMERRVCLDAYSYYYAQAMFDNENIFDYRKCTSQYINPSSGRVNVTLSILEKSKQVKLFPINCKCILQISSLMIKSQNGKRKVENFKHNAVVANDKYYFLNGNPEIEFEVNEDDLAIVVDMMVIEYDFSNKIFNELLSIIEDKTQKLKECIDTYEKVIGQKDREFKESVEKYEGVIGQKDREYKESAEKYEEVIAQKDREFKESVDIYEKVVRQKDKEFQESAAVYEGVIAEKDEQISRMQK